MADNFGYGQQRPEDYGSEFNVIAAIIRSMMARMATTRLVKVQAVHGGGVAVPGTVDVLPLVNQVDGNNNSTPHGTVYGIPVWRLQGGPNAIICDPVVGDIGYVAVSDRDISAVKSSRAQANPGSARKFDLADGIYIGGLLNAEPTQYLQFGDGTVVVKGTTSLSLIVGAFSIVVDATGIHLNGPMFFNGIASGATAGGTVNFGAATILTTGPAQVGSVASSGDVVGNSKSLTTHVHSGVVVGGGSSGPPV